MNVMAILSIIISLFYIVLIGSFVVGWIKIPCFRDKKYNISFSIVIPVRNEKENIKPLIESLYYQNYPNHNYEIIVVDDHSEDNTIEIAVHKSKEIKNLSTITLNISQEGKKIAIREAIKKARFNTIITLDADVQLQPDWLSSISAYYNKYNPLMLIAPVVIQGEKTFFDCIQSLEFLSLIASGAGAAGIKRPVLCNGANLIFDKKVFQQSLQKEEIASGDDIFLMLAIKNISRKKIHFIKSKESCVFVKPVSLRQFIQQRKRWTSKSSQYRDTDIIITAVTVLLINLFIIFSLAAFLFGLNTAMPLLVMLCAKTLADLPLLILSAGFFSKLKLLWFFPVSQMIYPFYVLYFAFAGLKGRFTWKERFYNHGK